MQHDADTDTDIVSRFVETARRCNFFSLTYRTRLETADEGNDERANGLVSIRHDTTLDRVGATKFHCKIESPRIPGIDVSRRQRLPFEIKRHCRASSFRRFSPRDANGGFSIALRLLRLRVCMRVPTRAPCQTQKERRGLDVEATVGLSRAVMDAGRLKFCKIPGSRCRRRRYFQFPALSPLPFARGV